MIADSLWNYRFTVGYAHDGDTLMQVVIDLGCHIYHQPERIRLLGINCPELNNSDPTIKEAAVKAVEFTRNWLLEHNHDLLKFPFFVHTVKSDSFGRWLGIVECSQGHNLNNDLLISGNAVPYK